MTNEVKRWSTLKKLFSAILTEQSLMKYSDMITIARESQVASAGDLSEEQSNQLRSLRSGQAAVEPCT